MASNCRGRRRSGGALNQVVTPHQVTAPVFNPEESDGSARERGISSIPSHLLLLINQ
jgi:hypothetical protein